ncbi:response regulator [Aestuariispira insulae]|uniref:CheY-like chemotaxis protein n=1 Tax=Aestuariispira insulae TaxID=1461337 RepID=A0A3D9HFU8_9PROT|nr:response regulator [Aestuariispira insulae]RED48131.1 CheY-like chemotaxis protein [Aestuariispira insulae]
MARFDFSRLSVLVVEDSQFMRSLIIGILRALGVERILTAENGEEAIAVMSPGGKKTQSMVGMTGVDIIVSDMFMPVVDGLMFLHWIRLSDKSPDRFLPFIMISAAADRDVIIKARDAGVDEFLAKPFSAANLASRFTQVIEHPRQVVYCPTYFGPDRRRRNIPAKEEKRVNTQNDVEIIHSGKEMAALKNSKKRVWYIRLPKKLKTKLATGFGGNDEPAFDPELLEAAEAKIADMEGDYADWVAESIEKLVQAHHRSIEDMGDESCKEHMATIHSIALELRGQGGIFGYPLMTQFGKSLYECTDEESEATPLLLDLINSHIDLIKVVMSQKIKGDGGKIGKELMQSLHEAKMKFKKSQDD